MRDEISSRSDVPERDGKSEIRNKVTKSQNLNDRNRVVAALGERVESV